MIQNKHGHKNEIIGWDNLYEDRPHIHFNAESISNFVDSEILRCERRIGKLWLENDMLNKKYCMNLADLCSVLDEMVNMENYEEQEINGFSILETVSDTRRWEHVLEDLEMEEARYMKLMEFKNKKNYE